MTTAEIASIRQAGVVGDAFWDRVAHRPQLGVDVQRVLADPAAPHSTTGRTLVRLTVAPARKIVTSSRPDHRYWPEDGMQAPLASVARVLSQSMEQAMLDLPLPPADLRFMGEDDSKFVAIGDRLVRELRDHAGLTDDARVVDIGSGYGRLAHALRRSGWDGEYLGVDVSRKHINWCNEHLGTDRVVFRHRDIINDRYNPRGTVRPDELTLTVDDVDVVALVSVFTHMWPDDVEAYLRLCASLLAPGGSVYATFFLFGVRWRVNDLLGRSDRPLPVAHSRFCRSMNHADPLHLIAYRKSWVRAAARRSGLRVKDIRRRGRFDAQQAVHLMRP